MMKHFMVYLALAFSAPLAANAQSNGQLASRKVKYTREQVVETKNGSSQTKTEETWYDRKGNSLEEKVSDATGTVLSWKKMLRTRDGRLLKLEVFSADGTISESKQFSYDKFKKLITESTFDAAGKEKEKLEYVYNNSSDKVSEITYGEDGTIKRKVEFTYDSRGLLNSRKVTNAKGEVTYLKTTTYEY
jgi:hypothetical protein